MVWGPAPYDLITLGVLIRRSGCRLLPCPLPGLLPADAEPNKLGESGMCSRLMCSSWSKSADREAPGDRAAGMFGKPGGKVVRLVRPTRGSAHAPVSAAVGSDSTESRGLSRLPFTRKHLLRRLGEHVLRALHCVGFAETGAEAARGHAKHVR